MQIVLDLTSAVQPALGKYPRFQSQDLGEIGQHTGALLAGSAVQMKTEAPGAQVTLLHRQADLPRMSLILFEYHCSQGGVWFRSPATRKYYIIEYCVSGSARFEQDGAAHSVQVDHFVLHHPDSPTSGTLASGSQHLLVNVERELLETTLAKQLGQPLTEKISFDKGAYSLWDEGNAVATLLKSMCSNLESAFPIMGDPGLGRQFENMLCTLLLHSLDNNYSSALRESGPVTPHYVRRVERFIALRACDDLAFADLVTASGVSSRTLHEGFRRHVGTTPMTYLKNVRLDLARAALSRKEGVSVTQVALDCGFTHLSKFATEYRQRFGERPSDTLRRSRLASL